LSGRSQIIPQRSRRYRTTTQTLPAGHDMMLDTAWEQTAMAIAAAIAERHARR